jgi:hypothetical protein
MINVGKSTNEAFRGNLNFGERTYDTIDRSRRNDIGQKCEQVEMKSDKE